MGTNVIIKKCDCKNEFQDKRYGQGMRVMNLCPNGSCRCTSCESKYDAGGKKVGK